MSEAIIIVENLGKRYSLRHLRDQRYVALRDVIANSFSAPFRRLRNGRRSKIEDRRSGNGSPSQLPSPSSHLPRTEDFWALKDVSFEVRQGEVVGIIGRNGAGKSTLLKILSRITEPTEGKVRIKGRVASLLEVGTGFHPELTGRENIFLNGAILGMPRAEIKRKFDEIVAFADVEKFLDMPAKRWPLRRFEKLVSDLIAEFDVWPVVFGGEEDRVIGDWLLTHWGRGYNAAGALGIRSGLAAMKRCRFFVGNDTGTMHMAAAVGLPCVAIFSSRERPGLWYPHGKGHRVFRTTIACEGCGLVECLERGNECINRITTDEVLSACRDILVGRSSLEADSSRDLQLASSR